MQSMGKISKGVSLFFVVIFAISILMMVEPSDAQVMPKPTVPEFTSTFVSVPLIERTPGYIEGHDSKKTVLLPGYTINNSYVQITIKNQAFTPYRDENGRYIDLYYNMSYKPHNKTEWNYYISNYYFIRQTSTNNTVIKQVPNSDQMDFRVQAKIAYVTFVSETPVIIYELTGQTSNWSNIQTITIPETSPSTTPTIPEFPILTITSFLMLMLADGLLVYFKKHKQITASQT